MNTILEELNNAAIKLLGPLGNEVIYETIVKEAIKLVNAEYGSIMLKQDGELNRVYSSSDAAYKTKNRKKGNTHTAFTSQKVLIIDISEIKKFHPELSQFGIKSCVFIPLIYEHQSFGVLVVNSKHKISPSTDELRILKLFGTMASLAMKNSQIYQDLEDALDARDLFISLASHELRTPLTSINGYIELLHSRMGNQDTVESQWIRDLHEENIRLTNLVKELLEVNRIKQGQLHFVLQECSMQDIVEKAIQRFSMMFPERRVTLLNTGASNKLDVVIGDYDKLLQVMSAVLQNAAKFSPKKSVIDIRVTMQKRYINIAVIDNGIGIKEKDLPHIFDGFYKGDKNYEGMGVGLLLAKHIISFHHGSIKMSSKPKKGAKIDIRLPLIQQI